MHPTHSLLSSGRNTIGDVWPVGAPVAPVATHSPPGRHRRNVRERGATGGGFPARLPHLCGVRIAGHKGGCVALSLLAQSVYTVPLRTKCCDSWDGKNIQGLPVWANHNPLLGDFIHRRI